MVNDITNRFTADPVRQATSTGPTQETRGGSVAGGSVAGSGKDLPAGGTERPKATADSTEKAVVDLNEYVQKVGREIQFSVDDGSGVTVIKVMNADTKEVIRQIPQDEVLALAEFLRDSQEINSTGFSEEA